MNAVLPPYRTPHFPAVPPMPAAQKESLRQQFAKVPVAKRVQIEVMSQDNKRVIQRYRFVPPSGPKGGKTRFTSEGVDHVLENFINSFERDNPDHKYRLVVCKDKYKLVWAAEEEETPAANVCAEAVPA